MLGSSLAESAPDGACPLRLSLRKPLSKVRHLRHLRHHEISVVRNGSTVWDKRAHLASRRPLLVNCNVQVCTDRPRDREGVGDETRARRGLVPCPPKSGHFGAPSVRARFLAAPHRATAKPSWVFVVLRT